GTTFTSSTSPTVAYLVATGTTASVLPYASTTALSSSGSAYFATSGGSVGIGATTTPSTFFVVGGEAGDISGHGYFTGGLGVGVVNTTSGVVRSSSYGHFGSTIVGNGASTALYYGVVGDGSVGFGTNIITANLAKFGVGSSTPLAQLTASSTSNIGLIIDQQGTSDIVQFQDAGSSVFVIKDGGNVGIGTTTPAWKLQVAAVGAPQLVISDTDAGLNLKHWAFTSQAGNLYIGTSTDAYATGTTQAISIQSGGAYNTGIVAVGTSTSYSKFAVWSDATTTGRAFEITDSASTTIFSVDNSGTTTIDYLDVGNMSFETDAGVVSWINMSSATSTQNLQLGYAAQLGDQDVFGIYASTSGSGSAWNNKVIVGTTSAHVLGTAHGSTTPFIISNGGFCVEKGGTGCSQALTAGDIYYGAAHASWTDVAEKYPSRSVLEAGDIVSLDSEAITSGSSTKPYVKQANDKGDGLIGAISTLPGLTLGDGYGGREDYSVALVGRIPVKVNLEAGAISVGDRIALSSISGVGMKATSTAQATIGIALEPFNGMSENATSTTYTQSSKILVFVNLTSGKLQGIANGNLDSGWTVDQSTGVMKMSTAGVLDMQGKDIMNVGKLLSASGKWSLDENGKLSVQSLTVGSPINPTGVTLFDRTNGTPYCFYIENGLSKTVSGECSGSVTIGATQNSTLSSLDTTAPVISLNGNNPAQLNIGDTYSDMGATVSDNADANLGVVVSGDTVDTSSNATYSIKYNATDNAGNHAVEVIRIVIVGTGSAPSIVPSTVATSTEPVAISVNDSNSTSTEETLSDAPPAQ
ncbi:MAG: DUF5011 domain-containing protein, partial [Candidatus Vogelbacteria bacterium]|nr:DUF5011 domain-containing protein [Candidatus Vogelbacteria bacterium]